MILTEFEKDICKIKAKIKGLVQDCSNSISKAPELLQSSTKPSR